MRCDDWYDAFEEESRRAEDLEEENARLRDEAQAMRERLWQEDKVSTLLRDELEEMTKAAQGAILEAKQNHEAYMSRVKRHSEALAIISRVKLLLEEYASDYVVPRIELYRAMEDE